MDAYDIFKKLTRGARFSKKGSVHQKEQAPVNVDVKIVKEDKQPRIKSDVSEKEENSITLLSSLNINKKSSKKRKIDTDHNEYKRKMLMKEEINHYRNLNNISVVGRHIPEPAKTFDDFNVDQDIIDNLRKCGYEEPTPIQKQAVPLMLQGRQILGCAPTGSGKTAAFLVPIIQALQGPRRDGFRAIILCPTRELAKQTQRECLKLSEGRDFRYGAKSSKKFGKDMLKMKHAAINILVYTRNMISDILITTPNRICFLLKQDPPAISLSNIQWLVIDEADKLFETGSRGFWDQLSEILNACDGESRKIAMFSATYTPAVAKWCVHNMKGLVRVTVGQRNSATDLVDQELLFVGNEQGKLLAVRDIIRGGIHPPVLIFVQSKERAQDLFNELIYDGINVDAIHSDRTQLQRDNTVKNFREGHTWVLICTELMARGVDFKGVNLVINYDFPSSAISYIHRVGRAGRAGRRGKAVTFFTTEDTVNLRSIAHVIKQSGCEVPSYMLSLRKTPKKERKRLEKSAPKRDEIVTKPIYERRKWKRRKQKQTEKEKESKTKKGKRKANIQKKNDV
ncbi:hypothetical protein NQ315_004580 [Exocentrus adspersus]|uniref:Probable ATP-dependent RNA helicase DDX52 n=1 Tax=Exocentrus adspersus TaxID=1586481 RepID=A0AAV8VN54_9CUCU|nr:hypothetical protein NQ315_004580 [Exocentrus adspersus]